MNRLSRHPRPPASAPGDPACAIRPSLTIAEKRRRVLGGAHRLDQLAGALLVFQLGRSRLETLFDRACPQVRSNRISRCSRRTRASAEARSAVRRLGFDGSSGRRTCSSPTPGWRAPDRCSRPGVRRDPLAGDGLLNGASGCTRATVRKPAERRQSYGHRTVS